MDTSGTVLRRNGMRVVVAAAVLLLAACGKSEAPATPATPAATPAATAAPAPEAAAPAAPAAPATPAVADAGPSPGAKVYMGNCLACHAATGLGMGVQPPLPGSKTVNGDVQALAAWVMFGVRPPTAAPVGKYPPIMPQFSYLKDEDLAAVLTHERSSWGNASPPVTVADIQAARAAHAKP